MPIRHGYAVPIGQGYAVKITTKRWCYSPGFTQSLPWLFWLSASALVGFALAVKSDP